MSLKLSYVAPYRVSYSSLMTAMAHSGNWNFPPPLPISISSVVWSHGPSCGLTFWLLPPLPLAPSPMLFSVLSYGIAISIAFRQLPEQNNQRFIPKRTARRMYSFKLSDIVIQKEFQTTSHIIQLIAGIS